MTLIDAIAHVAEDTRANTDHTMSDRQAIECARKDLTLVDLVVVDEGDLRDAYRMVLDASDADIAGALR